MHRSSRRQFLKTSSATVAGAVVFATPALARAASANGRLRVAVIGLGGRGRVSHCGALHDLAAENVEIAALCDCDEKRLDAAAEEVQKRCGKRPATFVEARKVFDDRSIDAVSLATPNHWHALQTIWACQAGKDVYVEKPASHNIFEGRQMVAAARKYKRIVQHGTQCRSSGKIREGIQKLREGVIGRVYMARGIAFKTRAGGRNAIGPVPPGMHWDLWLGPAPRRLTIGWPSSAGGSSKNTATVKSATKGSTSWTSFAGEWAWIPIRTWRSRWAATSSTRTTKTRPRISFSPANMTIATRSCSSKCASGIRIPRPAWGSNIPSSIIRTSWA